VLLFFALLVWMSVSRRFLFVHFFGLLTIFMTDSARSPWFQIFDLSISFVGVKV
jgi:hypothetical protein